MGVYADFVFKTFGNRQEAPPCQAACPVRTNVQSYLSLIAQGKYADAYEVLREYNPMPYTIGRICTHPCEDNCRRQKVDQSLSICGLKRFACENCETMTAPGQFANAKPRQEKIAIIGSGPAGLTAAFDLVRQGYKVTVFEKNKKAGGMPRIAIPRYRLDRTALDKDIEIIKETGVEIKTDVEIGKDMDFQELKTSFDAVVIAAGLSVSRGLPLDNIDAPGIHLAVDFLGKVNNEEDPGVGKNIIVVGGGNVATDVARSARRLDVDSVKMICLECSEEMPAHSWEVQGCIEEGIDIINSKGPKSILLKDGHFSGLEMKEVKSVFDEKGRFNPTFYEDMISTFEGDTLILAIGQGSDLSFLEDTNVELNERRQLKFDSKTQMTSQAGVFSCGEVITGPGAAIEAIASGHKAATNVDAWFNDGVSDMLVPGELLKIEELPEETISLIKDFKKIEMPTLTFEERLKSFNSVELGYEENQAVHEAQRCMNCGAGAVVIKDKCASCLTCVRVCPFDVPEIDQDRVASISSLKCQACGLCASECPAKAIYLRGFPDEQVEARISEALSDGHSILAITCRFGIFRSLCSGNEFTIPEDVAMVETLCTGRIDHLNILKAFKNGCEGIIVAGCPEDDCHFKNGSNRTPGRIKLLKEILDSIGIGSRRIEVFQLEEPYAQSLENAVMALRSGLAESDAQGDLMND